MYVVTASVQNVHYHIVRTHVHTYVRMSDASTYIHAYIRTYVCTYVHTYVHMYVIYIYCMHYAVRPGVSKQCEEKQLWYTSGYQISEPFKVK